MNITSESGNLKGKYHLGDLSTNRRLILKVFLQKYSVIVWNGLNSLRTGPNGGLL
jgi:hypothetical protein